MDPSPIIKAPEGKIDFFKLLILKVLLKSGTTRFMESNNIFFVAKLWVLKMLVFCKTY